MTITHPRDLAKYRSACAISMDILHQIYTATKPGVTPLEIDQLASTLLTKNSAKSSFFGVKGEYGPYRYNMCIAIDDVIVHGIPNKTPFKPGDIVKLDFGLIKDGFYTDHCVTIILEQPRTADELKFVQTAKAATLTGVQMARIGNQTGDIGHAMHAQLQLHQYDVAKEYIGHGIGKTLHEKPAVPAYGRPHTGSQLKNGMVLCVEAQVVEGSDKWYLEKDGWTVKTADGRMAAMFEYMTLVTNSGPEILTDTTQWDIIK